MVKDRNPRLSERGKNKTVAYMQWIIALGEFYFEATLVLKYGKDKGH